MGGTPITMPESDVHLLNIQQNPAPMKTNVSKRPKIWAHEEAEYDVTFDSLTGAGFTGFDKRTFDSLNSRGFTGFDKRAFDSLLQEARWAKTMGNCWRTDVNNTETKISHRTSMGKHSVGNVCARSLTSSSTYDTSNRKGIMIAPDDHETIA
uniref:Uncharacterized protein n=1 Tax=Parascaris equorum TaxID=6256 RepID=A0A914RNN3_PAREQ